MQHGPAAGWCSEAVLPEEGNVARPLVALRLGTRGRTPSRYTCGPSGGQQHLRRGTAQAPQYRGQSEVVRVAVGLVPVRAAQTVAAYMAHHNGARDTARGRTCRTHSLFTISVEHSRDERAEPILVDGA